MKILRIMSIVVFLSITGQIAAMAIPKAQPLSTLEWLFGYRSYTPEEQGLVDLFSKLNPKTSILVEKWLRENYKDNAERKAVAEEFVEFIKTKNLEKTFPAVYSAASSVINVQEINPEDRAVLEGFMRGQHQKAPPTLSKESIKKGHHPGISIKE